MTDVMPLLTSPIPLILARDAPHTTRAVRAGELVPVLRGVYAPAADWTRLAPWERHLARVHALVLLRPDDPACLESAAALHGLPIFGDPGTVHVIASADATSRLIGGVQTHTTRDAREIGTVGGALLTGLVDTVIDIARVRHPAIALATADAALRRDPSLTVEALVAANESRSSTRGRRHARWALHRASALPESPLESIDRAVIEWLGFPEPELQVHIGDDRVDKWWADRAVAGESDGDLKYDGRFGDPLTALRERHRRDARLFRHGARAVPHWGWSEALAADPLDSLLRSAGLRPIRPREHAPLFALQRTLARPR